MSKARDLIIKDAVRLLEQDGREAVTIRRVAEASNFGRSTVVHHFTNKAGLIDALYIEALTAILEHLHQPTAFSSRSPGADVMAKIFPDGAGAAPPLLVILESFRQDHPELWLLLRFHPCPTFDLDVLSETAQTMVRRLVGDRANHEAALCLVAQTRLAFHDYVIGLPATEAYEVIGRAPGSEFLRRVFNDEAEVAG